MNSFTLGVSGDTADARPAILATQPAPARPEGPIAWVLKAFRWWWTAVITPTDVEEREFLGELQSCAPAWCRLVLA